MRENEVKWPPAESVVAHILMRDWYANLRLHYVVRMVALLILGLVVTLFGTYALINRAPQFRYVLTDETGLIMPIVPLSQPNQTDEFVLKWTIDAVTRLYTFDYINYRDQFQDSKVNMTTTGWKYFEDAMSESNNWNSIIGNAFVTTAVPTGPGKLTKAGDMAGRYAWKIEFPMLISYRTSIKDVNGAQRAPSQQFNMTVVVVRQPEYLNPAGLGIRQMVAQ